VANIIQLRRDTAANWTSVNPILAAGEAGFETDTKKLKVGDGTTAWQSLGYYTLGVAGYATLAGPTFTGAVNASGTLQLAGTTITSTAAELNILDGVTSTAAELNILDGVTSTAAELNILDGVTSTAAELNVLDGVTATVADLNATKKRPGLETIYVPAPGMHPNLTDGAANLTQVELSNGPELKCIDFAAAADDFAQFTVAFPKSWNEGTVTFQPFWTVTGTNTGTVAWGLAGVSIANDVSINTAFGTAVVNTPLAHSGTSNDMMVSAVSGAVTIANAAVDTLTYFQIHRDVSADTQTGDARLLGIKLFFTTDAANDA
jgi:hypothetical protein